MRKRQKNVKDREGAKKREKIGRMRKKEGYSKE
jgi:hypothetical protein